MIGGMEIATEIETGELADLVKQVQAGNEILLTQNKKPVARLVAAHKEESAASAPLRIRSYEGHKVLTPVISQAELADEMLAQK
jgi:prevent-host-death family protein